MKIWRSRCRNKETRRWREWRQEDMETWGGRRREAECGSTGRQRGGHHYVPNFLQLCMCKNLHT